jgi:DNA-binding Lrp family transcriptional regulator
MNDQTDFAILNALQEDLPLVSRPWQAIADSLGTTETEMLSRMKNMEETGIIRGISPVLESRPMGLHAATLVALHVPDERIEETAAIISGYTEVSHNFQRDHYYSIWFTLTAQDDEDLHRVLDEILQRTMVPLSDMLDLLTVRKIKIDVRFSFPGVHQEEGTFGQD